MKFYLLLSLLLIGAATVSADDRKIDRLMNELAEGMSYNEVLRAWGSPLEKIEHEAKRVSVWVYNESQVRFLEGKLIGIEQSDPQGNTTYEPDTSQSEAKESQPVIAVADILNEIMDESSK